MRVYSILLIIIVLSSGLVNTQAPSFQPSKADLCMYNQVSSMSSQGQKLAFALTRTQVTTRLSSQTSVVVEKPTTQAVQTTTTTSTPRVSKVVHHRTVTTTTNHVTTSSSGRKLQRVNQVRRIKIKKYAPDHRKCNRYANAAKVQFNSGVTHRNYILRGEQTHQNYANAFRNAFKAANHQLITYYKCVVDSQYHHKGDNNGDEVKQNIIDIHNQMVENVQQNKPMMEKYRISIPLVRIPTDYLPASLIRFKPDHRKCNRYANAAIVQYWSAIHHRDYVLSGKGKHPNYANAYRNAFKATNHQLITYYKCIIDSQYHHKNNNNGEEVKKSIIALHNLLVADVKKNKPMMENYSIKIPLVRIPIDYLPASLIRYNPDHRKCNRYANAAMVQYWSAIHHRDYVLSGKGTHQNYANAYRNAYKATNHQLITYFKCIRDS